MAGLRKLCKLYGSLLVKDEKGAAVRYVWDYASDKPAPESEMPFGSERHAASERAKWGAPPASPAPAERGGDGRPAE